MTTSSVPSGHSDNNPEMPSTSQLSTSGDTSSHSTATFANDDLCIDSFRDFYAIDGCSDPDIAGANLPVSTAHALELCASGISADVASDNGVYTAYSLDELPQWARWVPDAALPALVYPMRTIDGLATGQVKPRAGVLRPDKNGRRPKYISPGRGSGYAQTHFIPVRPVDGASRVLVVEGVKQALAAQTWCPDDVAIYRITGIWSWRVAATGAATPDLAAVANCSVTLLPDGDVRSNPSVLSGASALRDALVEHGCDVSFASTPPMPGKPTAGIDDYLASLDAGQRRDALVELLRTATSEPVDAEQIAQVNRRTVRDRVAEYIGGRKIVGVHAPAAEVASALTDALLTLTGTDAIYRNSNARLVRLEEQSSAEDGSERLVLSQVDRPALLSILAKVAYTTTGETLYPDTYALLASKRYAQLLGGAAKKGSPPRILRADEVPYPSPAACPRDVVEIMLSSINFNRFPVLDAVVHTPQVRPDGSIATTSGYDPQTRLYIDLDDDLEALDIPEKPTPAQVDAATSLLRDDLLCWDEESAYDEWVFKTRADQTHAAAMMLSPLLRSITGLAPIFLADGCGPGAGKDALVDVCHMLNEGKKTPKAALPSQKDEVQKHIVAQLLDGASSIIFNEAQSSGEENVLNSPALRNATTTEEISGRRLCLSESLTLPNRALWFLLGNRVEINQDIARRVLPIQLYSDHPALSDRGNFRIENPPESARARRPELLTASLTLIRNWYAQGEPEAPRLFTLGSFSKWQRIVGGILYSAGFEDFLANVRQVRKESNFADNQNTAFLAFLEQRFAPGTLFTTGQVFGNIKPGDPVPYGVADDKLSTLRLARTISQIQGNWYDHLRIVKASSSSGLTKWTLETYNNDDDDDDDDNGGGGPQGPGPTDPTGPAQSTLDRLGITVVDGDTAPAPQADGAPTAAQTSDVVASAYLDDRVTARPATPRRTVRNSRGVDITRMMPALTGTPVPELIAARERVLYLDFETADADQLYTYGPGFLRLAAYAEGDGEVQTTADIAAVAELVRRADLVIGHKVLSFDLAALDHYYGIDLGRMVAERRVLDTLLVARQIDPPVSEAKNSGPRDSYSLDTLCEQAGIGGKLAREGSTVLRKLADTHGGFDAIPVDDADYIAYAKRDVELVRSWAQTASVDNYLWREHEIDWRTSHMTRHGFRVDTELLAERLEAGTRRRDDAVAFFAERFGTPATSSRPHATSKGRAALEELFGRHGIDPARTGSGHIATGKEHLPALRQQCEHSAELTEVLDAIAVLNGERTIYQTIDAHTVGGRIHPQIESVQATGRFSITNPGLTVLGKRGVDKVAERAVLLPDEGHVLITADLSNIDGRAIGACSADPGYIQALQPGTDMHDQVAATVFGSEGWDQSGHHPRRGEAKAVTHATNYGMGASGLAKMLSITAEDASRLLDQFAAAYPGVERFKTAVRAAAQGSGDTAHLLRSPFGRNLRVRPGNEYTQAPATIGQSTARDLLCEAVLRLPAHLLPGLRGLVHDEIILSVPADQAESAQRELLDALQFSFRARDDAPEVPILAETGDIGTNWADCYRSEYPELADTQAQNR